MKTLIAYYTFSGKTKGFCERSKSEHCDLYEIKEVRKRGVLSAYINGGRMALQGKPSAIMPLNINTADYDLIVVASPVWAGSFAPAAIAFLKNANLKNKKVVAVANSAGGKSNDEKIKELIKSVGADCINIYNIKNGEEIKITEIL